MNGSLRSILYLAITIAILVLVFKFVSFMLPYVLIAALIIFYIERLKVHWIIRKKNMNKEAYIQQNHQRKKSPFDSEDGEIIDEIIKM